jgi:hypothetical protein
VQGAFAVEQWEGKAQRARVAVLLGGRIGEGIGQGLGPGWIEQTAIEIGECSLNERDLASGALGAEHDDRCQTIQMLHDTARQQLAPVNAIRMQGACAD